MAPWGHPQQTNRKGFAMPLLTCDGITAGYGDLIAVRDLSLTLEQGSVFGLVGPNGAGKSTLLKAITGVIPLRSGTVTFEGQSIGSLPPEVRARKGMTMVQEGRRLWPTLNVRDNLMLGAYHQGRKEQKVSEEKVLELFPALQLILKRSASVLSGGEQQMVAVGRALMAQPKVLLIDEPSLGLAPIIVDEIYASLPKLVDHGVSIILVEQEVRRVLQISTQIGVLHEGEIVYQGDGQKFKDNPEALTEYYLGNKTDREGGQ
jgi:branched-chain amino acid transport system ATP-binding protein